jgi:hypothetical protein
MTKPLQFFKTTTPLSPTITSPHRSTQQLASITKRHFTLPSTPFSPTRPLHFFKSTTPLRRHLDVPIPPPKPNRHWLTAKFFLKYGLIIIGGTWLKFILLEAQVKYRRK